MLPDINDPERASQEETVRAIRRTCKGRRVTDAGGHPIGELRMGCGYDVNELICAASFDGSAHSANCPWCGQLIEWTAPSFVS